MKWQKRHNRPLTVAYINPKDWIQFERMTDYFMTDGSPAVDILCLFAANYVTNDRPMLRADNDPYSQSSFNPNILSVFSKKAVRAVQDKGIAVLLTIMNGHTNVGWSEFQDEGTAQAFVDYLKSDVVDRYGLDGIDIDDEYSSAQDAGLIPSGLRLQSLPMVTTLMRQAMPDKLITKALFNDAPIFAADWQGHTLGQNLDYGWQMAYYTGRAADRLFCYEEHGMTKQQLCLGFSLERNFTDLRYQIGPSAKDAVDAGYAGCMMFGCELPDTSDVLGQMVDGMNGAGSFDNPHAH